MIKHIPDLLSWKNGEEGRHEANEKNRENRRFWTNTFLILIVGAVLSAFATIRSDVNDRFRDLLTVVNSISRQTNSIDKSVDVMQKTYEITTAEAEKERKSYTERMARFELSLHNHEMSSRK